LVRPLVWLFIFAAGFRQMLGISIIPPYETYVLYEDYVTPGLIAMIQLFNGMPSSLSMVYDREMGNMRMLLVSKLLASTAVSILQVAAFGLVAWLWGGAAALAGVDGAADAGAVRVDAGVARDAVVFGDQAVGEFLRRDEFRHLPDAVCFLGAVSAVAGAAIKPGGVFHLSAQPVHLWHRGLLWDQQVFQSRRESLSRACDVPMAIEQRLFGVAKMIEKLVE
jgi:hypothetical protein